MGIKETFLAQNIVLLGDVIPGELIFVLPGPEAINLVLEKAEETEIKLPTSAGSPEMQESSRKSIYFCFIDYAKAFDCVDHNTL